MFSVQNKNIEQHLKEFLLVSGTQFSTFATTKFRKTVNLGNRFTEIADGPDKKNSKSNNRYMTRDKNFLTILDLKTLPTSAAAEVKSASVKMFHTV